ncbi:MAG: hypothetical protein IPN34_13905 [Planctomycetes bacterium]|nr:hypothetical protein [Planctomycetota bacterium]
MTDSALVFTHIHKCSGSSLRRMLHAKYRAIFPAERMHIPEITCRDIDNLPMLEARGEPLPRDLWLLADHSPHGIYEERVLASLPRFRIALLREPLDRLESLYHFFVRAGFLPEELKEFIDLETMPEQVWERLCQHFLELSGYVRWFDPVGQDVSAAVDRLLAYDVLGRHDDLADFCSRFSDRNPHGVRLSATDVLHVNATARPAPLSRVQQEIAYEALATDYAIWEHAQVQRALRGNTPDAAARGARDHR